MTILEVRQDADASLLGNRGISPQISDRGDLVSWIDNKKIFDENKVLAELNALGYPVVSMNALLGCGKETGYIVAQCGCGRRVLGLSQHCDLRTCARCSNRRKKRIRRRFLPYLEGVKQTSSEYLYFLTISPQFYGDLRHGLDHVRASFDRFRRSAYVKERIKGGFYVLETKQKGEKWFVHLHAIVFGRQLDNRIRGKCLDCKQSLMKKDYINNSFYCANKSCNSLNVVVKSNSKVVSIFKKASGRACNVHINRLNSVSYTLNYMLKYVSCNKDSFTDERGLAVYMCETRKTKVISAFGLFFAHKVPKFSGSGMVCKECNQGITFIYDIDLAFSLLSSASPPPLLQEVLNISYQVVGGERSSSA